MNSVSMSARYRTIDVVTITTLGVAFGVVFWGWGKLYGVIGTAGMLTYPPSGALLGGGWLIAGVVGILIVRRPGAAVGTELIAASVSAFMPGNEWGMSALYSGAVQGLGVELVFALFAYRAFGPAIAMLSGAVAGAAESVYEWFSYYDNWDLQYRLVHMGFFTLSGAIVAGLGGWLLVQALARAGALDAFSAGREQAAKV